VIAWRAFGAIIGNKLAQFLAREILTKAAMLNTLLQTTLDKVAVRMERGDTARAFVGIVGTFSAVISTECCFWIIHIRLP